jgi:hypothetical protein
MFRRLRTVHVVYDLGGAGRVVGVFRDAARAARVVALNPAYYKLTSLPLDTVTPAALQWAGDERRPALEQL